MAENSNRSTEKGGTESPKEGRRDTLPWPSLHPPDERIQESAEAWMESPSREVTGDDPESVNAAIERDRKREENAPGVPGQRDETGRR